MLSVEAVLCLATRVIPRDSGDTIIVKAIFYPPLLSLSPSSYKVLVFATKTEMETFDETPVLRPEEPLDPL